MQLFLSFSTHILWFFIKRLHSIWGLQLQTLSQQRDIHVITECIPIKLLFFVEWAEGFWPYQYKFASYRPDPFWAERLVDISDNLSVQHKNNAQIKMKDEHTSPLISLKRDPPKDPPQPVIYLIQGKPPTRQLQILRGNQTINELINRSISYCNIPQLRNIPIDGHKKLYYQGTSVRR